MSQMGVAGTGRYDTKNNLGYLTQNPYDVWGLCPAPSRLRKVVTSLNAEGSLGFYTGGPNISAGLCEIKAHSKTTGVVWSPPAFS